MKKSLLVWVLIGLVLFTVFLAVIFILGPKDNSSSHSSTSYKGVEIVPDLTKDGIPPLNFPGYESGFNELGWLTAEDRVIGIEINGDPRAFPLKIMSYHEIVNDTIGGENVAITYNPLCGSSVMFSREFGSETLELGNTGALYEGCTVMYDTSSNSYWFQVTGQSIRGEHMDSFLTTLPSTVTTWGEWLEAKPLTQVLSVNTGYTRNYLEDPFGEYYTLNDVVAFPPSKVDERLPGKTPVIGIVVNDKQKAYVVSDAKDRTISDMVEGQKIEIVGSKNGDSAQAFFINGTSRAPAPVVNAFWFAWYVNYPNTDVYSP